MKRTVLVALAAGFALAGAGLYLRWQPSTAAHHAASAVADTIPAEPAMPAPVISNASVQVLTRLQSTSLAGIDIPRTLSTDADGQLQPDEGLRTLMEFFLALEGEMPTDDIRNLFSAAARAQCAPACADAALQHFDRYRTYLADMQEQQAQFVETDDLRTRLENVRNLRHTLLGDTLADAFFGYEEQYDRLRIAQWEIHNDPTLSDEEKAVRRQALDAEMPAALREREQPMQLLRQAQALQQQHHDADALQAARADLLGDEAARRLRDLDQQRAAWNERYTQYQAEKAQLLGAALDEESRAQQLDALRQRHFNAQESQRVSALDRINDRSTQ